MLARSLVITATGRAAIPSARMSAAVGDCHARRFPPLETLVGCCRGGDYRSLGGVGALGPADCVFEFVGQLEQLSFLAEAAGQLDGEQEAGLAASHG